MNEIVVQALRSLRDIKGIQGSFIVRADSGELLGRDMPGVVDDAVLIGLGPRIDRLQGIMDSQPPTESVAMRFADQRLGIRRMGQAHLCVLAEAGVSQPALRMAMKLVSRKLEGHRWDGPAAPSMATPTAQAPGKRTVQFRGRTTSLD
jgi:hypothetical protein